MQLASVMGFSHYAPDNHVNFIFVTNQNRGYADSPTSGKQNKRGYTN